MSALLDQLKVSATSLSVPERAELASYLLESLEPVDEAWHTELARRMTEIRSGEVTGTPMDDVLSRLRERYP